jgi:uncharacterized secreted protein with C-terminal beta-propeller domain
MHIRRYAALAGAITLVLVLAGCPQQTTPAGNSGDAGKAVLKPFTSGDEVLSYFRQQASAQLGRSGSGIGGLVAATPDIAAAPTSGAETGAGTQDNGSTSYSTTNIQEEGVDESDVFKSDGTSFYIAKGKTLRIVRATPMADLAELSRVAFDDTIDSLYLVGTKALVLSQKYAYGGGPVPMGGMGMRAQAMMWPPYYVNATTVVSEVDISDPAAVTITKHAEFDGSLVSSRVTNDRLILVLTIAPALPDNPNIFTLGMMTLDQVTPMMRNSAGVASPMVAPESWFHPESPDGYFTTAVVTLDTADIESVIGSVAVMANAGTIYVSTEALYLTNTDYTADNQYRETTAIHKLAFDANGVARYTASGSVSGRLLNQFSLGEYNGALRVATHVSSSGGVVTAQSGGVAVADAGAPTAQTGGSGGGTTGSGQAGTATVEPAPPTENPHNAVYVLQESAGTLTVVGSIEDIAPNENLYAARFIGARGFLVTFRQIDPLFVLDLTDPTTPALAGQLKIPGYSDYLHPFGDNLLIGVGGSTRQSPWGGVVRDAIQLSLFDVSDLANPTLIQQLSLGGYGSQSDVSYTHKAFTFLPDRGLLAIPAELMSEQADPWSGNYMYQPEFDGVLCFQVDATGFTQLGRVSSVIYDELGWTEWRRGAFIEDTLYAVTPAGVRAASLQDFATPAKLVLTPNDGEIGTGVQGGSGQSSPGSAGGTMPTTPPM